MLAKQVGNRGFQGLSDGPTNILYQVQIYYRPFRKHKGFTSFSREIKKLFIPFISNYVFLTPEQAQAFAPSFLDYLIKEGAIREKDIFLDKERKQINTENLGIVVSKLSILAAEEKRSHEPAPIQPKESDDEIFDDLMASEMTDEDDGEENEKPKSSSIKKTSSSKRKTKKEK